MSYNTQKPERLAQDLLDAFALKGLVVTKSYDTNRDIVFDIADGYGAALRILAIAQTAPNLVNPVTQQASAVYVPHIFQVGIARSTASTGTVTLAAVVAGDTGLINGNTYTAAVALVNPGDFIVGGTDAASAANLAAVITALDAGNSGVHAAVDSVIPEQLNITANRPGSNGDTIALVDGGSTHFVVSGATLSGGLDGATSPVVVATIYSEVFGRGLQVEVFATNSNTFDPLADFVDANRIATFRNTQWGNLAHI